MYTLEIKGRAIAVIYADEENARELLGDDDFQDDLRELESGGTPLWNGKDELTIRPATDSELQTADGNADEDDDEDDEEEGEMLVVFLAPLDDEDEDDEDEDEDAAP